MSALPSAVEMGRGREVHEAAPSPRAGRPTTHQHTNPEETTMSNPVAAAWFNAAVVSALGVVVILSDVLLEDTAGSLTRSASTLVAIGLATFAAHRARRAA